LQLQSIAQGARDGQELTACAPYATIQPALINGKTDGGQGMTDIKKDHIVTQEETGEPAPIDQVEERVEAEMKRIEGRAKESVGQGLQDEELEREGRKLEEEGEREKQEG
jgi:uncharacterized protein YjbJ (UPF0337 family)